MLGARCLGVGLHFVLPPEPSQSKLRLQSVDLGIDCS